MLSFKDIFESILVLSNDKFVEFFLNKKIKFTDIQKILFQIINDNKFKKLKFKKLKNVKEIIKLDEIVDSKINKIVYKI